MEIKAILNKLKKKQKLTKEEIKFFVDGYVNGKISREEMTEFIKLIYKNGLTDNEIFDLTDVMTNSGEVLSFSGGVFCDKHSTGGVSDSTTLIVMPIIALSGLKFLKMSGKKLGFTGGTIDKIEQFDGYNSEILIKEAEKLTKKNGACLLAQTKDLAPADKVMYKLRDETGYVNSLPLIASSIMCKKLASGADVIVLDVKCGSGAFMKTIEDATKLAEIMVKIGKNAGKKICAIVSDMNQPLGSNVGSLMETIDAIEVLEGKDGRLKDLSILLAAKIIEIGKNITFEKAKAEAFNYLNSGLALEKLKQIVKAQGGSLDLFNKEIRQKIYKNSYSIKALKDGYLTKINTEKLGEFNRIYCAEGNAGMSVNKKIGDKIKKGENLLTFYGNKTDLDFLSLFEISNKQVENPLIYKIIV
ncbi:MAG: thymidine phosphorylase [Clostridia bacterium]|nr:thymidine phosphorylase [Clostridia bacterium]